jgi:hypothetical protein
LVILVVVGLLAAMDAVHAMNVALPRRQLAGTVAILPWVLLLLAFTLWLVILRHFRVQQSPQGSEVTKVMPVAPSDEAHEVLAAVEAGPGGRPALAALPTAASGDEAPSHEAEPGQEPQSAPEEEDLEPGLRAEGPTQEPTQEPPEGEAPPEVAEAPTQAEAQLEAEGAPEGDYWENAHHGDAEGTPDEVTEVGGVPHATGPRLRRIRSLPATPVDED